MTHHNISFMVLTFVIIVAILYMVSDFTMAVLLVTLIANFFIISSHMCNLRNLRQGPKETLNDLASAVSGGASSLLNDAMPAAAISIPNAPTSMPIVMPSEMPSAMPSEMP